MVDDAASGEARGARRPGAGRHPSASGPAPCCPPAVAGLGQIPGEPLVQADGGRREPKPGHRFPDVEVRTEKGATRLYRVLGGGRHVLLLSSAKVRAALDATGPGPYPWLVDVVEGCADARDGFALVRPDGVLAARGSGKDIHRVTTYLRHLCGAGPVRMVSSSREASSA